MTDYTLFIDESETSNSSGNKFFVMAGVIIKNSDYLAVEQNIENIKRVLWNNAPDCEKNILHEKDISFASNSTNKRKLNQIPNYQHIFTKRSKVTLLYNELSKLLANTDLYTMGVCMDRSTINNYYGESDINNQLTISIQLLIEHYCQFLIKNNATGSICYESMQIQQNDRIQQRLYELMALGTMYYSPKAIQSRITKISFSPKSDNIAGLQLADFIPNALGRHVAGLQAKNHDFSKNVRKKLYDGGDPQNRYKFGCKILK